MCPLPAVSGVQVVKALRRIGFDITRIHGSHHVLRHLDGRNATVPVHRNRDLSPGTLRSILRKTGLPIAALEALL